MADADPNAAIRAAVAGAPQTSPPANVGPALLSKGQALGYGGVALVAASYVLPAVAPDIDKAVAAHFSPFFAHLTMALVGAGMALAGRARASFGT